jgi:hypothetical protein
MTFNPGVKPAYLRTAAAVRTAAERTMIRALCDDLPAWTVDLSRMDETVAIVASATQAAYPDGRVPIHSRWRHFELVGRNWWLEAWTERGSLDPDERLMAELDLAVLSALLDAGAGPDWQYRDRQTGQNWSRSEGLAIASLEAFTGGSFGAECRASGAVLATLSIEDLSAVFQCSAANPLIELDARAAMIQRLGKHLGRERPSEFLFRTLDVDDTKPITGPALLEAVLALTLPVWPDRPKLEGQLLGDCWQDTSGEWVPIHKLAQWLSYSLIEPFVEAGYLVMGVDQLTGLAEYRNGGLFLDLGVIQPREPAILTARYQASDPAIVEWRSLTIALLDDLTEAISQKFAGSGPAWPVARVLQGGSWDAGRKLAAEKRGGLPPLNIVSDGTIS